MKNITIIAPICGYAALEWGVAGGFMPFMAKNQHKWQPLNIDPLRNERQIYQQTAGQLQQNNGNMQKTLVLGFDDYYAALYGAPNMVFFQKLPEILPLIQKNTQNFDSVIVDCNNPLFWFVDYESPAMADILLEMDKLLGDIARFAQLNRTQLGFLCPYPLVSKSVGGQLHIFYLNDYIQKRYPNQCTINLQPFSHHPYLAEQVGQVARVEFNNVEAFGPDMFDALLANELFYRQMVETPNGHYIMAKNNWVFGGNFALRDSAFTHNILCFGGGDGVHQGVWYAGN